MKERLREGKRKRECVWRSTHAHVSLIIMRKYVVIFLGSLESTSSLLAETMNYEESSNII